MAIVNPNPEEQGMVALRELHDLAEAWIAAKEREKESVVMTCIGLFTFKPTIHGVVVERGARIGT
jgi:hypothetical protein